MGRPKTEHSATLRFRTRPEAAQALALLSASTGLAQAHLVRLAVDRYLVDLGLLGPTDLTPTRTTRPNLEGDIE